MVLNAKKHAAPNHLGLHVSLPSLKHLIECVKWKTEDICALFYYLEHILVSVFSIFLEPLSIEVHSIAKNIHVPVI